MRSLERAPRILTGGRTRAFRSALVCLCLCSAFSAAAAGQSRSKPIPLKGETAVDTRGSQKKTGGGPYDFEVVYDLRARYVYDAMMGEPLRRFEVKADIKALRSPRHEYRPADDTLNLRDKFDKIEMNSNFTVEVSFQFGSNEIYTDTFLNKSVNSRRGDWTNDMIAGSPNWNSFLARKGGGMLDKNSAIDVYKSILRADGTGRSFTVSIRVTDVEFNGLSSFADAFRKATEKEAQPPQAPAPQPFQPAVQAPAAPGGGSSVSQAVDAVIARRLNEIRNAALQAVASARNSGRIEALDALPSLRGKWQALNRFLSRENLQLSEATRRLNQETDHVVNLRDAGLVKEIEDVIALHTAKETAREMSGINFVCNNHHARILEGSDGRIRFKGGGQTSGDATIALKDMTSISATRSGNKGTLVVYVQGGSVGWTLGDCGNIDNAAASKLEKCKRLLDRGIARLRDLRRQMDKALGGVVEFSDRELALEIDSLKRQTSNAAQGARIGNLRKNLGTKRILTGRGGIKQ